MSIIDNKACKELICSQIQDKNLIKLNAAILGAFLFKSKREHEHSLALWNDNLNQAKGVFSKLSPEKQEDLSSHVVIEVPFVFEKKISLYEVYSLIDTSGSASNILGFVSCVRQVFPAYPEIPSHVQMCSNYIRHTLQNFLKSQFPQNVFISDNKCFITANLLNSFATDALTTVKYINSAIDNITELKIKDINSDYWHISVIERDNNNWCSFLINCRRSILKDFSTHNNCKYSNIYSSENQLLNRKVNTSGTYHLVTVFNIKDTLNDMKNKLVELETLDILNALLV